MKYTAEKWKSRIRNRSDISSYLSHLTKGTENNSAVEILLKILTEKRINGSSFSGYIAGKHNATCFQDVPIYSLCQNTFHEQIFREELGGKVRYTPVGLAFSKRYVYLKGGRPVIYEKLDIARQFISENELWRVVSFDLSNEDNIVDWTHEREWRVKGDFEFELKDAYVLLTKDSSYHSFVEKAGSEIIAGIGGIIVLDPVLT